MLREGTQKNYILNRINMPTTKSHAELQAIDAKIKAQSFFSARVAEASVLNKLREVSDGYSQGNFGLGEARNMLKEFMKSNGQDNGKQNLSNLASTARLNLILKQNAAMAKSAAQWQKMHDPDAMKVFPYVKYHARNDGKTRSNHSDLDGKIFDKNDPFLQTHTPPWEFNCRCYLEEITAKQAGREVENIQKPTPQDKVKIDSTSGFVFNPAHAFEEFDLSPMKTKSNLLKIKEDAMLEFGSQITFLDDKAKFEYKEFKTWENMELESIKKIIQNNDMPKSPVENDILDALNKLETEFEINDVENNSLVLGKKILEHWKDKDKNQNDARLSKLNMAIETLKNPLEIWDQDGQKLYLQVFQKDTGGTAPFVVYVLTDEKQVITFFRRDLKGIDLSRKGTKIKKFY